MSESRDGGAQLTVSHEALVHSSVESGALRGSSFVAVGLLIAIGGSAWSALGHCKVCAGVATALYGLPLGWLGVAFYVVIFCLVFQGSRIVLFLLVFAAGIHVGLISLLILSKSACLPCITTAFGAWLAAGCAVIGQVPNFKKSTFFVLGCIACASAWSTQYLPVYARHLIIQASLNDTLNLILQEDQNRPNPGTAKLIIFERVGCKYCTQLKNDVLPEVSKQFGALVVVETRTAPKNGTAPIEIVIGHSTHWAHAGLIDRKELIEAISDVIAVN